MIVPPFTKTVEYEKGAYIYASAAELGPDIVTDDIGRLARRALE
jgi:hypothetical protein